MDAFMCNWPCISERRRHAAVESPISRNPSDGRWQWIGRTVLEFKGAKRRRRRPALSYEPAMHDLNLIFWWICRRVDRVARWTNDKVDTNWQYVSGILDFRDFDLVEGQTRVCYFSIELHGMFRIWNLLHYLKMIYYKTIHTFVVLFWIAY